MVHYNIVLLAYLLNSLLFQPHKYRILSESFKILCFAPQRSYGAEAVCFTAVTLSFFLFCKPVSPHSLHGTSPFWQICFLNFTGGQNRKILIHFDPFYLSKSRLDSGHAKTVQFFKTPK